MKFTARQIAEISGGTLSGNPEALVSGFAKIEEGGAETLCFIANPKYEAFAHTVSCAVLLLPATLTVKNPGVQAMIHLEDPYSAFTRLLQTYQKMTLPSPTAEGIHPMAFCSPEAKTGKGFSLGAFSYIGKNVLIGENVTIYPMSYIGDHCTIGDGTTIYSGVQVYAGCVIGRKCILHSGCVIGSDGFGFAPQADGRYLKIPQTGIVEIGDEVEIGANTVVDRATMGSTRIEEGVKLDNLIQVAHNVEIGAHTVIAAQTGISGSTRLGRHMMVGGQAAFVGHLRIADGTKVQARSAVKDDVTEKNKGLSGAPAMDAREHYRQLAALKQLPDLIRRVQELEKQLKGDS
jgi:UDP-3-O-[3-hydroxymyristoyl] glucosamine N-acyltransferase